MHIFLKNSGEDKLPEGNIIAKIFLKNGTVKLLTIYNETHLEHGETTELIEKIIYINRISSIKIEEYEYGIQDVYSIDQSICRGFFGWYIK